MKKCLLASVLLAPCIAVATSAVAVDNLAGRHAQEDVQCAQCHVEKVPSRAPKMDTCLTCHGGSYEALAKTTAKNHPNPHYTHVGDKECTVCHKGHRAPEFFCNECHRFKVEVP